jgi:hypothetical protein
MINQRIPDLQELADSAAFEAEELLERLNLTCELFGELANWDGSTIGSDL